MYSSLSVYHARQSHFQYDLCPTWWCIPQPIVISVLLLSVAMRIPTYLVVQWDGQGLLGERARAGVMVKRRASGSMHEAMA